LGLINCPSQVGEVNESHFLFSKIEITNIHLLWKNYVENFVIQVCSGLRKLYTAPIFFMTNFFWFLC